MRRNAKLRSTPLASEGGDPRHEGGAKIIDLATRNVLPTVTQRKRADGFGLVAGIAIVAVLGAVTLWSMDAVRTGPKPRTSPQSVVASRQPRPVPQTTPIVVAPASLPAPSPQPVLAAPPQSALAAAPSANPHASPTVVFDASGLASPLTAPAIPGGSAGTGNSNDDFAARLGGVGGVGGSGSGKTVAEATFDPKTTVTQGTLIPAVLETAIDTDVPGFVRAVVSTDVRSFDGSRVLVPRSSRLIGQYKSGLAAGQKRAYVIWTRLIRPDGVSVNIGSPAISFGGETGLEGKVNSHFFERFGSAMLLSVVGGLSAIGGNAGVIVGSGGQSAAAAAIGQNGQISPTVRIRQGQPIRVFTTKDLDFSKVS